MNPMSSEPDVPYGGSVISISLAAPFGATPLLTATQLPSSLPAGASPLGQRAARSLRKRTAMDRERMAMSVFTPVVDNHELSLFMIEAISLASSLGEFGHCDLTHQLSDIQRLLGSLQCCIYSLPQFERSPSFAPRQLEIDVPGQRAELDYSTSCLALDKLVANFEASVEKYNRDICGLFSDCLESLELDGVPMVDDNGEFIEFELYVFEDFCAQASPHHLMEVFECMD